MDHLYWEDIDLFPNKETFNVIKALEAFPAVFLGSYLKVYYNIFSIYFSL